MISVEPCPPVQESRLLEVAPLIRSAFSEAPGYGRSLATTAMGPATLQQWCVWIEPAAADRPDRWEQRWLTAVGAAFDTWSGHLPLVRVQDPDQAQVQVLRQRPPRRRTAGGWRASNGRSRLQLVEIRRQGVWRFEPTEKRSSPLASARTPSLFDGSSASSSIVSPVMLLGAGSGRSAPGLAPQLMSIGSRESSRAMLRTAAMTVAQLAAA